MSITNPYLQKRPPSAALQNIPRPPSRGSGGRGQSRASQRGGGAFAPGFNAASQEQSEVRGSTQPPRMQRGGNTAAAATSRNQATVATTTQSTNNARNSARVSKITLRLRALVKKQYFPKISKTGLCYLSPNSKVGTAATKSRKTLATDSEVRNHIREHFPNYPTYKLPNPEFDALDLKGQGGYWTSESAAEAANLFYVPEQTEVVVVFPDLFNRKELRKYPQFCKPCSDGGVGILTPCPWCKTNEHVKFSQWNVQKWRARPRVSVGRKGTPKPLVGPVYDCENPSCAGKPPTEPEADGTLARQNMAICKSRAHQFVVWSKDCFSAYPTEVQACYSKYLQGIGMNNDNVTFAAADLIADILDDRNTFARIEDDLASEFERLQEDAEESHKRFVKLHGENPSRASGRGNLDAFLASGSLRPPTMVVWPSFDRDAFQKEHGPPKEDATESLYFIAFERIKPFLIRDECSRLPDRIVSWDGTFSLAKKTMGDLLCDEEPNVIALFYDEYGRVLFHGFAGSEAPIHWQRINYFVRSRCERAGLAKVHGVVDAYSDLCCENFDDRKQHWIVNIWPSITEAPKKDLFHAMQMVTGGTRGVSNQLHANFCSDLTCSALKFTEGSICKAVDCFQAQNPSFPREAARREVLSGEVWRKKMYNFTAPVNETEAAVLQVFAKLEEDDAALQQQAASSNKSHQTYILKETPGVRRGTKNEVDNFLKHLRKGCYQDKLPPEEMSFSARPASNRRRTDTLPDLRRRRGTNGGESTNKQINRVGITAARMRLVLSDSRVLCRIARLNRDKDAAIEHITGKAAKPKFWWLTEALDKDIDEIPHLDSTRREFEYPPEDIPEEPIGKAFLHCNNWDTVDRKLYCSNDIDVSRQSEPRVADPPRPYNNLDSLLSVPAQQETNHIVPPVANSASDQQETNAAVGYSSGATTWNRREGGMTRVSPHRQAVREPLTTWQVDVLAQIVARLQQTMPLSVQSITAFTHNIAQTWNELHVTNLVHGRRGLGGNLPLELARARVERLANDATRDLLDRSDAGRTNFFLPRLALGSGVVPGIQYQATNDGHQRQRVGGSAAPTLNSATGSQPILPRIPGALSQISPTGYQPMSPRMPGASTAISATNHQQPCTTAVVQPTQQHAEQLQPICNPMNVNERPQTQAAQQRRYRTTTSTTELQPLETLSHESVVNISRDKAREYARLHRMAIPSNTQQLKASILAKWIELTDAVTAIGNRAIV